MTYSKIKLFFKIVSMIPIFIMIIYIIHLLRVENSDDTTLLSIIRLPFVFLLLLSTLSFGINSRKLVFNFISAIILLFILLVIIIDGNNQLPSILSSTIILLIYIPILIINSYMNYLLNDIPK
ncbi:hypothetical protein ERTO105960_02300 [Erysipelothrix tonsillarum]